MDTKALSARLIELSYELTVEQRWYDRAYACLAKHMARGTQESRTEATGHVKHGANLRSERAAELRTLATEAPQAIRAELYRLANTLETSGENVAGAICELAADARSNAEPAEPEGAKPNGNDRVNAILAAVTDDITPKILKIAGDTTLSSDAKLRLIARLDSRFKRGKTSGELGTLIGVTGAAVRDTDWWKVDRKKETCE